MSEPGSVVPSPPSPFQPRPIEPRSHSGGCRKPLVIGCVAVLLVGAIAVLGGLYYVGKNAPQMMKWSLSKMEEGVMSQLPPAATATDRQRLQTAFDDAARAIEEGRAQPELLQEFNFKVLEFSRKGKNATREDVEALIESLEKVAQGGGPSPPSPP